MASLEYALRQCHPRAVSNRRAILFYLIPLSMLHARLPSQQLLAECCFPSYDVLTRVLPGPAACGPLKSPVCPELQALGSAHVRHAHAHAPAHLLLCSTSVMARPVQPGADLSSQV